MSNEEKLKKYNEMCEKRKVWSKNWREKNLDKVKKYSLDYSKKLREFYKKWNGKKVMINKEVVVLN
jgi:flavin-dependent dehydrogenase